MRQKGSGSEVTMSCHFYARRRLQCFPNVSKPSKAHFAMHLLPMYMTKYEHACKAKEKVAVLHEQQNNVYS